jgi:hypothetical protein
MSERGRIRQVSDCLINVTDSPGSPGFWIRSDNSDAAR